MHIVKKCLLFILLVAIATLIAGLYGMLHDQFTYSISPEYYTKFKFIQFGFATVENTQLPNARLFVAAVGFLATWWMGIFIGVVLSTISLIHLAFERTFKKTIQAFLLTMVVAFATGLVGLVYGKFYLAIAGVNWWLPQNLEDKEMFIAVGSMHNFSYLGGAIGLVLGILFILKQKKSHS